MGTEVLSQRWLQEREVDQSNPSNVDIKKERSCTSTLPYSFMARTGTAAPFLPFVSIRTILRYFEGISLNVLFTEILILTIAIWSLSQPPYILCDISVT